MEKYIKELINIHIENKKCYDSVKNNENGILDYLNSLNDNDLEEIAKDIYCDTELMETLESTIDYYLFHYKEWFKEKEEINNSRICNNCNKEMNKGYCIENGMEYYCSNECLHKHYTEEEFKELYDNGNGDSYWTDWECEDYE